MRIIRLLVADRTFDDDIVTGNEEKHSSEEEEEEEELLSCKDCNLRDDDWKVPMMNMIGHNYCYSS